MKRLLPLIVFVVIIITACGDKVSSGPMTETSTSTVALQPTLTPEPNILDVARVLAENQPEIITVTEIITREVPMLGLHLSEAGALQWQENEKEMILGTQVESRKLSTALTAIFVGGEAVDDATGNMGGAVAFLALAVIGITFAWLVSRKE